MISNYQRLKDFVFTNLKKNADQLTESQIAQEVQNAKGLIDSVGETLFAQFLPDKSPVEKLTDIEWARMAKELEQHFNVKMEHGILIQGDEQQRRDTTWWSGKEKIKSDKYYWNRYRNYIAEEFAPEVVTTTDEDTDQVMNNIGDPSLKTFSHKGMVVGHVQSGKTANYSALVCKAADAGYKFVVVIAGGTNNLRDQTQERLNESFIGLDKGKPVGAGIGNSKPELLPICLTTNDRDFNKQDADKNSQGLNFDNIKVPILIVIKKHPSSLKNVIKWLKNQYKNTIKDHAMLVIDDESDYASINYKDVDDPTSINKRIRELLGLFEMSSYVAYTATPYANIFIDHEAANIDYGTDLFPKDFIYALDAPSDYFSARKIFLDSDNRYLVPITDFTSTLPLKHKIDFRASELPSSLYESVRLFVLNIAIRKLRGQSHEHNSMLIHISRFTNLHQQVSAKLSGYISMIADELASYGSLPDALEKSSTITELKQTLELRLPDRPESERWEAILISCVSIMNSVVVREVHLLSKIPLEYRDDVVSNVIVVGGASLSRGFTLKGLSVSYFLRTTVFYDTLMQMGRWFGYRPGYQDLCRIYMPQTIMNSFAHIIEATEELFTNLKKMAASKRTPNDFGLVVREHPESLLQITARNKQKNTHSYVSSMNLNGYLKETVRLFKHEETRIKNRDAIDGIVQTLLSLSEPQRVGNDYLWRNVESSHVAAFLEVFQSYQTDSLGAKNLMPIRHIQEYVKTVDTKWDVALYSGSMEIENWKFPSIPLKAGLRAAFTEYDGYIEFGQRKVSAGNPEHIVLTVEEKRALAKMEFAEKGDRTAYVRSKLNNPLLMLHILNTPNFDDNLAAFGVCFPNNGMSQSQTVSYKVNTVFESGLDDVLSDEDDFDE